MRILFFTAPWCPTCKAMYPVWGNILVSNDTYDFRTVDCDSFPEQAIKYSVQQLPTFIMTDDAGVEVGRFNGFKNETSFQKWLDTLG